MKMPDEKKLIAAVGFSVRSGKAIFGVDQICETLGAKKKKGKYPLIVIEAADTSANTHKKITDKCTYYDVRHIRLNTEGAELARAFGKSSMVAAVALTDENLCRLAENNM
jgi:ribosomal protein L7Ae-like RNA K-turn-binding protein